MSQEITYYDIRPPYCYLVFDEEISEEAKVTMLRVMRHVNKKEPVSIMILADELETDPFTVKRNLNELEEKGLNLWDNREDGRPRVHIKRV